MPMPTVCILKISTILSDTIECWWLKSCSIAAIDIDLPERQGAAWGMGYYGIQELLPCRKQSYLLLALRLTIVLDVPYN